MVMERIKQIKKKKNLFCWSWRACFSAQLRSHGFLTARMHFLLVCSQPLWIRDLSLIEIIRFFGRPSLLFACPNLGASPQLVLTTSKQVFTYSPVSNLFSFSLSNLILIISNLICLVFNLHSARNSICSQLVFFLFFSSFKPYFASF